MRKEQSLCTICHEAYTYVEEIKDYGGQKELILIPPSTTEASGIWIKAKYERGLRKTKIISVELSIHEKTDYKDYFNSEHIRRCLQKYGGNKLLKVTVEDPGKLEDKLPEPEQSCSFTVISKNRGEYLKQESSFKAKELSFLQKIADLAGIKYTVEENSINIAEKLSAPVDKESLVRLYKWISSRDYLVQICSVGKNSVVLIREISGLEEGMKKFQRSIHLQKRSSPADLPLFGTYLPSLDPSEVNGIQDFVENTFNLNFPKSDEFWKIMPKTTV
ncbi:MAG: hypothetical protein KKA62_04850 [Nanoarchaeota archaeon]|nr:hypothetical protein [Nanoarchaeota archaeon]MBU1644295.1 hypothetical protein [Nanoarchaeota archaeon]MBU1977249.1 hypothetical protein [Nanoarchaeota archaeon]